MKKYYSVKTKCGHVGRFNCVWIDFAVVADSAKEASHKVKEHARVKHHHKDVVKEVVEISFEEYMELRSKNDADPYLHCKSIQDQRNIVGFEERVELDAYNIAKIAKKTNKRDSLEYRTKKIKLKEDSQTKSMMEWLYCEVAA